MVVFFLQGLCLFPCARRLVGVFLGGFLLILLPSARGWGETLRSDDPIQPLLPAAGLVAAKVRLGAALFADPALSADGTVSCASCHDLAHGGADHQPRSHGVNGAEGVVRALTVFNSGLNFAQFWDGRAATLEEQVDGPLTNPREMASSWQDVLVRLGRNERYKTAFRALYGGDPSREAVRDAIASFERSLVTVDSPFDRYLRGDDGALNETERQGYHLFTSYGCASCHQGANVGGNLFQKFGFLGNPFAQRGGLTAADYGRYNVTGIEADRFVFKVPSLRLAAVNSPYFHDGSAGDLGTAVRIMGRYQLGREIPDGDLWAITAFLGSLVGDPQARMP